jgi:uncharacterized SAM-binding protein YcdF (DUF218 family)
VIRLLLALLLSAAIAGIVCFMVLVRRAGAGATLPSEADVIVVLHGSPERERFAEELVRRGVAPRILSTLVDPDCVRAGNPPQSCPSRVRNTVDEALLMRRALPSQGIRRLVVVTSNFHRLRAAAVFKLAFAGSGIDVRVVAPPGPSPRWSSVSHELWSFVPSAAAAIVGRFSPSIYESIVQRRGSKPCLPPRDR